MFTLRFLVIATSVILGTLPNSDGSCVLDRPHYHYCSFHSKTEPDCPVYQKSIDCLEEMKRNCSGTAFEPLFVSSLKWHKSSQAICPGLPDGSCYFGRTNLCLKKVNYLNPGDETCKKLKTLYQETKKCLNDLKPLCNSPIGIKHVAGVSRYFERKAKKCGVTK